MNAPYRQRLRYENTVYMRGVDSHKQAGPLCQRPGFLISSKFSCQPSTSWKAKEYLTFQWSCGQDKITLGIQQFNNTLSGWASTGQRISRHLHLRDHQWQEWHSQGWQDKEWRDQRQQRQRHDLQTLQVLRRFVRKVRATRSQPLSNSPESSLHA